MLTARSTWLLAFVTVGCGQGDGYQEIEPPGEPPGGNTDEPMESVGGSPSATGGSPSLPPEHMGEGGALTACQRFCDVGYKCPHGSRCPDSSCYDYEACRDRCQLDRERADRVGCAELNDEFYVCASKITDGCDTEDPVHTFQGACIDEVEAVMACHHEDEETN